MVLAAPNLARRPVRGMRRVDGAIPPSPIRRPEQRPSFASTAAVPQFEAGTCEMTLPPKARLGTQELEAYRPPNGGSASPPRRLKSGYPKPPRWGYQKKTDSWEWKEMQKTHEEADRGNARGTCYSVRRRGPRISPFVQGGGLYGNKGDELILRGTRTIAASNDPTRRSASGELGWGLGPTRPVVAGMAGVGVIPITTGEALPVIEAGSSA